MTTTAPWSTDALTKIREPIEHTHTVTALIPGSDDVYPIECTDCSVTFDEGWTPHVQAQVVAPIPDDLGLLDGLDPRRGARILFDAGYVYPAEAADVHALADLALFARPSTRPADTLSLTAYSDEQAVIDWTPLGQTLTFTETSLAGSTIAALIRWVLPAARITIDPAVQLPHIETAGVLIVTTGDSVWEAISDVADRVGAWVYLDGLGTWTVTTRPETVSIPSLILDSAQLEGFTSTLSRADWANAVLVRYTFPGVSGVATAEGWAEITTGPLAVAAVGRQTRVVERKVKGSPTQAAITAHALVSRTITRGRTYRLTTPAAYWIRPGHTVTVTPDQGSQRRLLVLSVTFRLHTGLMDLTLREPEAADITTGE